MYSDEGLVNFTVDLGSYSVQSDYENLLKSTKFLYTYDPYAGAIRNAIIFGAIPVVLNRLPWTDIELSRFYFETPVVDLVGRSNLHYRTYAKVT